MAVELLSNVADHASLPSSYVRPESQRPRLEEVITDATIPTIDLTSLNVVAQVAHAGSSFGFFQVVNHGVEVELMREMMEVALEFFRLPAEEKAKHYSDDPAKKMRLSTSFNIKKETMRNWRDYLRLHCYPLEEFVPAWPSNPPSFKEVVSRYCREVRRLGMRILRAISLSLELEEDYLVKVLGEQEQHMAINHYPKCPEPELTFGLQAHTDPNALTILLQDPTVAGLQVLKDGQWIAVNPQPNALVINIGDQLQVIKHIPKYAKFLKDLCVHKRKLKGNELVSMEKNVSALIQVMPPKCKDPGVFTIPCVIGECSFSNAMLDLGASINVMPKSVFLALGIGQLQPTGVIIQLANRSLVHPAGVIKHVLVKVKDLIFPADFYILDMEGDTSSGQTPLILGRPFLKTARTKIDVHTGAVTMEFGETVVQF